MAEEWIPVSKDGRLKKKIIKEGDGDHPPRNTKVNVKYIGRFTDGRVFDSSKQRGKPFSFVLGAGQVISGWDLGVQSMKKGEKCILECPYDYAYGEQGFAGVIPPRATLLFEIKLIDW